MTDMLAGRLVFKYLICRYYVIIMRISLLYIIYNHLI